MKKFFIYSLLIAFVATFTFTGCKQDNSGTEAAAYETLTTHLKSIDLDIDHVIKNADGQKFVMGAPVDGNVSSKWVMDIRSATDFAASHIEGAHNVAFSDILTEAATADKPILVVCYTGQTACYATSLLRLYGHEDAQALKWGMSGWNAQFDKWTPNCKDLTDGNNWTATAADAGSFNAPAINSTTTEGAALLKERVEAVVAGGFKAIAPDDVLANPGNFYINNYFSDAHYTGFGHVNGAVRISPLLINDCSKLDPSSTVITYCYTGQTSAVITAYLNVLGFDAKSLKFGVNGMTTSNPFWEAGSVTNHWGFDSNPKDLPTVN
ncbi:MAG: rhodanese-like domain-containing protein [Bacteroidota bacterium]